MNDYIQFWEEFDTNFKVTETSFSLAHEFISDYNPIIVFVK